MSYTYTDNAASILEIKMPHEKGFLIGLEGDTGEYTNIVVENEDAPEIALEILKAAGWPLKESGNTATDQIVDMLARVVYLTEKTAADAVLKKRRDELAVEYFEGVYGHLPRNNYRRAIDRIIELESRS